MPKQLKSIPQTTIGRAGRLFLSSAKMVSSELLGRFQSDENKLVTRVKQAQEMVATLGQLKGAAMKAGQMFSLEFADILPPEVMTVLRQLHDDTQFMPLDQVRHILAQELGFDKRGDFENISHEPIAAASIGQVHRATLNGKDVAVKIQYPGIAKCIDTDVAALRRVADLAVQIQGHEINLDPLFSELKLCLKQEADYRAEADHLYEFGKYLDSSRFVVPQVYRDYSSERVLTMSFEGGLKLADWFSAKPNDQDRAEFAEKIIDLLIKEIFVLGVVQSDPNFGNFLYRAHDKRLVLLDFGATIKLPQHLQSTLGRLVKSANNDDMGSIFKFIETSGLIDPRESDRAKSLLYEIVSVHLRILSTQHQPHRFRNPEAQSKLRQLSFEFVQEVKHTPPPRDYIFLGRKVGGMLNMLRDLDAVVDVPHRIRMLQASQQARGA